jgi:hypothetical protein
LIFLDKADLESSIQFRRLSIFIVLFIQVKSCKW